MRHRLRTFWSKGTARGQLLLSATQAGLLSRIRANLSDGCQLRSHRSCALYRALKSFGQIIKSIFGASSGKCCYNNCVQQPPNLLCQLDLLRFFCDQTCMKRSRGRSRCCPNPDCSLRGQAGKGNVIRHSFYITSQGRRRRYRCKKCGRTFSSTHGTPYYRLHKPRSLFDEVVRMCVHGVGISAVARIKRMAWGTVARWLESAAICAARFNDRMLKGFVIRELQADEIRTFVGAKKRVRWVLTTLEVWSRLWISFRIGTSQTSRECCSIPCGEAVLNTASCSPPMVSRCTSGRRKGCSLESVSMVK